MDIIKISLLGVCGVILGFLMKGTKPEYACFITVGIGLVIMGLAVGKIYYLFESLGKNPGDTSSGYGIYFNDRNYLHRPVCLRNL